MSIIISLVSLGLGLFLIHRWKVMRIKGLSPWWISAAFLLKVMIGVAVWFIYSQVYDIPRSEADVFKYFDDGLVLAEAYQESPLLFMELFTDQASSDQSLKYQHRLNYWERSYDLIQINDNRSMIRVNALLAFISKGDYHVHSIVFNFIALLGLILLFKGLSGLYPFEPWVFIVCFVLPPSLLFWASAPLKEALVLLPMGMLLYSIKDIDRIGPQKWLLFIAIVCSVFIKPYVGLAMLPGFLFLVFSARWKGRLTLLFIMIHALILAGLYVSQFLPSLDVVAILSVKQKDFFNVAQSVDAGSVVDIPRFHDLWTFIQACPSAIWRTYFRPGVWEIRSMLDGVAALENMGYLLLLGLAVMKRSKQIDKRMLLFCLSFIVRMAVLIGTVTPVLGASVRYRVPALPFLLLLMYIIIDRSYIASFFNKKRVV